MAVKKLILKDGTTKWIVRVYANGRESKRIKHTFDRRIDAENFDRNYKAELLDRKVNPYRQVDFEHRTFKTEAENWLENAKLRFSPGSLIKVKAVVRDLLPRYGEIPIPQFTAEVVSKVQREEKKKGLEDSTVNRKCQVIIAILNYAVKQRRIPYNPAQGFSKLREAQKESTYWSREEASDFLATMSKKYPKGSDRRWVYAVYLVALNTALRAGEIWGLKPEDLSPYASVISVRRQLNQVTAQMTPTKNRKSRMVPCSNEVASELKDLIQRRTQAPKATEDTIFRSDRGGLVDQQNFLHRVFYKDLESWGGKRIRFHDLRHTATTLMIASGVDIRTVKEICGHADIDTTMNYVHLVASSVERVPQLFSLSPVAQEFDEFCAKPKGGGPFVDPDNRTKQLK